MAEATWQKVETEQGKSVRWAKEPKGAWQTENTEFFGTSIEGVYRQKREGVGANSATIYEIKSKEHGLLSVWSTTVLADRMSDVPVGAEVKIECTGEAKSKSSGKMYETFEVMFRETPMESVGTPTDDIPFID